MDTSNCKFEHVDISVQDIGLGLHDSKNQNVSMFPKDDSIVKETETIDYQKIESSTTIQSANEPD